MRNCFPRRVTAILAITSGFLTEGFVKPLFAQRNDRGQPPRGVYKLRIFPHWFDGDSRLWYRNDLAEGRREFILVDAEKGVRQAAFDHQRLAASLSAVAGRNYAPNACRSMKLNTSRTHEA